MDTLSRIIQYDDISIKDISIRLGAALGLLISLLAIGGIRLLKWICVVCLPFLALYNLYTFAFSDHSIFPTSWGLSFSAIIITVLLLLPGIINLPTFFRHSLSRPNSYLALTLMTVFNTFLECTGIWMNFNEYSQISNRTLSVSEVYLITHITVLIVLLICNNLLNIYFASACYETFIPRFSGTKGYAIMGLLGTIVYTFVQISSPIEFTIDLFNCYITSIGIVLLIAFLVRTIVRHRPRKREKLINVLAWILGCLVGTIMKIKNPSDEIHFLLAGAGASALFFLVIIFIEETFWSLNKIITKKIA